MGQDTHPITEAIRRRRPESNWDGWYYEISDATGCSHSAVKSWLYGTSVPDRENLEALVRHFGREFLDELVWAQFGWRVVLDGVDSRARDEQVQAHLQAAMALYRDGNNASVPLEGKVS